MKNISKELVQNQIEHSEKKMITKNLIMRVYFQTKPPKGGNHFERMIDWFESNDYKLTKYAVNNIYKYIEVRKSIFE